MATSGTGGVLSIEVGDGVLEGVCVCTCVCCARHFFFFLGGGLVGSALVVMRVASLVLRLLQLLAFVSVVSVSPGVS